MKNSRFADMVPPTPEDFRGSVADALNRLESAPSRRPMRRSMPVKAAAVLVAIASLSAMAVHLLGSRLPREDLVLSAAEGTPAPAVQTVRAESDCGIAFALTDVRLENHVAKFRENSVVAFEWKLSVPADEALLFSTDFAVAENDSIAVLDTFGGVYALPGSGVETLALAGGDVLGCGNGAEIVRTERIPFAEAVTGPVTLMLRVNVFRPLAEFIQYDGTDAQTFEGMPKWIVQRGADGVCDAQAIDYYGRFEDQTPYGSDFAAFLGAEDFFAYNDYGPEYLRRVRTSAEELEQFNGFMSDLRRALLQMYGFAQPLTEFVVRVQFDPLTGECAVETDVQK